MDKVHQVKLIVTAGVAHMKPHHWAGVLFVMIAVSTACTVFKAKAMYNQEFLEWRRKRRVTDPNWNAGGEMQQQEEQAYMASMREASALQQNARSGGGDDLERGSVRRRSSARPF
jgi:hypothetical protein